MFDNKFFIIFSFFLFINFLMRVVVKERFADTKNKCFLHLDKTILHFKVELYVFIIKAGESQFF